MNAWENSLEFKGLLEKNELINKYLSIEEIEDAFDIKFFLRNVSIIYKRVGIL